ncbi:hypothetical protein GGI20_006009, partial [Coemansia sp. BCRC 34301]
SWLDEPEMASVFEFVSSLGEEGEDGEQSSDEDAEVASWEAGSDLDSPASPAEGLHLSVGSAMPLPMALKSRSPLKRAREERIEELTREIDELLDSDSGDDDNGYLSAEE